MSESKDLVCPECGSLMILRETKKYPYPNGRPRKFYGCSRFPECRAAHGAHPNGEPCGVPGDAQTKAARMLAHEAFDRLWKPPSGTMNREQAYRLMQRLMQTTPEQAHIAKFDVAQCERLVKRLEQLRPRFNPSAVERREACA